MNICRYCNFFDQISSEEIWYNALCKVRKREKQRDPIYGKWKFIYKNDLGDIVYSDQEYEYCKNVNINGECGLYQSKKEPTKNAKVLDNEGNWVECSDDFQETLNEIDKALGKSWKL